MPMPAANSLETLPLQVFREYDIRGKANTEIGRAFAYLLGRALAGKLHTNGCNTLVIGRDNRASSPDLHHALVAGVHQTPINVIDVGEVTSPMLYYALEHLGEHAGVMITASHNPADENGFKIVMNKANVYGPAMMRLRDDMRHMLTNEGVPRKYHWDMHKIQRYDIATPYMEMLENKIKLKGKPLKVVVDCGNGTASSYAPRMLERWGCEVIPLYCESDPTFPNHHPDPVEPANLRDLIRHVREHGADVGLAFDGDGDRLGVVDERGDIVWGDRLMIVYLREIFARHPGIEVPIEVKCSKTLIDEVERHGGRPFFHRTGHSHMKATMKQKKLLFAGEMSGHLYFRDDYFGYDDALYAAGRLLRVLSASSEPLSALLADVPQLPVTPETRLPCREEDKARIVSAVASHFRERGSEVIDTDGARILFPDGWGLIRHSNTQSILVLRAEADTEEALRRIKRDMADVLADPSIDLRLDW